MKYLLLKLKYIMNEILLISFIIYLSFYLYKMLILTLQSTPNSTPPIKPEETKHPKSDEKSNRQLVSKRKNSFCSYQPFLTKL